jgi:RimJ/RimL family protein N-acetyltransferase
LAHKSPIFSDKPRRCKCGLRRTRLRTEYDNIRDPDLTTERLRLRAFAAGDLDAYAAMQANPEVMRFLVDGRTHTRVEV